MTRRRDAGLTLIEILVASALLSVFFASVYGLVAGTLDTRTGIEEQATPFAVGPAVMERLVEDLRGAIDEPYKDHDVFKAENETVNGQTGTKVDFVTTVPSRTKVKIQQDFVKARINEVGYRLRRSETDPSLNALYRREDLGVDEEPLLGGKYYKLADRVKEFRIDWFAKDAGDPTANDDDSKGEETWDSKKEPKLPYACRITLTIVGDTGTDDRGRPLADAPQYTFVTYVPFPSRLDKEATKTNP